MHLNKRNAHTWTSHIHISISNGKSGDWAFCSYSIGSKEENWQKMPFDFVVHPVRRARRTRESVETFFCCCASWTLMIRFLSHQSTCHHLPFFCFCLCSVVVVESYFFVVSLLHFPYKLWFFSPLRLSTQLGCNGAVLWLRPLCCVFVDMQCVRRQYRSLFILDFLLVIAHCATRNCSLCSVGYRHCCLIPYRAAAAATILQMHFTWARVHTHSFRHGKSQSPLSLFLLQFCYFNDFFSSVLCSNFLSFSLSRFFCCCCCSSIYASTSLAFYALRMLLLSLPFLVCRWFFFVVGFLFYVFVWGAHNAAGNLRRITTMANGKRDEVVESAEKAGSECELVFVLNRISYVCSCGCSSRSRISHSTKREAKRDGERALRET